MMEPKYVYLIEFKAAKWKRFQGLMPAETEETARAYVDAIHPGMTWFFQQGNLYARRKTQDDKKIITYRITRREMITADEVSQIQEWKARRAQQAKVEVEVAG